MKSLKEGGGVEEGDSESERDSEVTVTVGGHGGGVRRELEGETGTRAEAGTRSRADPEVKARSAEISESTSLA